MLPVLYVTAERACPFSKVIQVNFERNFYVEKLSLCQIQQVTFIISVLRMPRQEDCREFEASLNYRSSLRKKQKERKETTTTTKLFLIKVCVPKD